MGEEFGRVVRQAESPDGERMPQRRSGRRSAAAAPSCRVVLRPRGERGESHAPGVISRHHFCFAGCHRSDRMSWGALRGLSQYDMAPGVALPARFHAGLEIVTIVLGGRWRRTGELPSAVPLEVNEAELVSSGVGVSLGGSAGTGGDTSLVEIRVATRKPNRQPRRQCLARRRTDLGRPIATGAPPESDALLWQAAARLHYGWLEPGDHFRSRLDYAELGYLLVVDGAVCANGVVAQAGDGVSAAGPGRLEIEALERARLVWMRGL